MSLTENNLSIKFLIMIDLMNISKQTYRTKIILLFIFMFLSSCISKKNISSKIISKSDCPIDGNCEVKCLKNQSLIVKNDSVNGVNYEIIENPKTNVYLYSYQKNDSKEYQDGSYREEIIFEIPIETKNLNLTNEALQTTKMLFGRFCYCKGFTGYYKIESGNLRMNAINKTNSFVLDFAVLRVPQVLKSISFKGKI